MYQSSKEYLEDELYTLLELTCFGCRDRYSPMEFAEWTPSGNLQQDAGTLKYVYTDKAMQLGWTTNSEGDALCPECAREGAGK